jgi:hypothetical protein
MSTQNNIDKNMLQIPAKFDDNVGFEMETHHAMDQGEMLCIQVI